MLPLSYQLFKLQPTHKHFVRIDFVFVVVGWGGLKNKEGIRFYVLVITKRRQREEIDGDTSSMRPRN